MKIAVGIPAFNEEVFVEQSIQNCLEMEYDYVVYLDDGSTDRTYEKLMDLTRDLDHIKVIKDNQNSVVNTKKMGRWETVCRECQKVDPDWIMVRAADEVLSAAAAPAATNALRKNLEALHNADFDLVSFQYIDFWRSPYWYRADGFWGIRSSISCWRNDIGWEFKYKSGIHQGAHRPNKFKKHKVKTRNINMTGSYDVVVLHYGMSSDELLERKFKYQLDTVNSIGVRAHGVPNRIPSPVTWNRFNGYKVAHEFDIELRKAKPQWFFDPVPDVSKPKIKSLAPIIEKYDARRAKEYELFFKKKFGG